MSVIDKFLQEILILSLHGKRFFCLSFFFNLGQIFRIKICHIVTREHTRIIEGRRWFIDTEILDTEGAAEDGVVDNEGDNLDE